MDSKEAEKELLSKECSATGIEDKDVKVPIWRILLLCSLGFVNQIGYAVISAYAVPLLVAAGLDLKFASLSMMFAPLLAILTLGYIGHCSDHCQCSWGRRRPFILFFSALICLGYGATPFVPYLSTVNKESAIVLTIIGVLLMTYSQGAIQLPMRAYLLDCVPTDQVQLGNFIYTIVGGIGTMLGFAVSAFNWAKILQRDINIINEAQGACIATVILTVVCTIFGLCSFKETAINKFSTKLENIDSDKVEYGCLSSISNVNIKTIKFIWYLSKEMWILWLSVLLGTIGILSFGYFFTTFVGESIYGGDPHAPQDSKAYQDYVEGVRMGLWGLAAGGLLMSILSICQDKLANWMGLKRLYILMKCIFVLATYGLTLHIFYDNNLIVVILLGSLISLYTGLLLSVPFILVYKYKKAGLVLRKPLPSAETEAVTGRSCFVIVMAYFMAEFVVVIITGPLAELLQTTTAIVATSTVFGGLGVAVSLLINVPE